MAENTKGKVLIVDDEDTLRASLALILEMEGYEVVTAENGYQAIEAVRKTSFDIALMDIIMPGLNGVETFLQIKKISPEITAIMMTAYAANDLVKQALREGAYTCLSKPFSVEKVIEFIDNIRRSIIILIADGHAGSPELLASNLKAKGYRVITVANTEDTFSIVKRRIPDVILLHSETDAQGIKEVVIRLKDLTEEKIPIIMVAGSFDSEQSVVEAMSLGVQRCLKSPVSANELEEMIRKTLGEK